MSHGLALQRYTIYMDFGTTHPLVVPGRLGGFRYCDGPGGFGAKPAIWIQGYAEDFVMDGKL